LDGEAAEVEADGGRAVESAAGAPLVAVA